MFGVIELHLMSLIHALEGSIVKLNSRKKKVLCTHGRGLTVYFFFVNGNLSLNERSGKKIDLLSRDVERSFTFEKLVLVY